MNLLNKNKVKINLDIMNRAVNIERAQETYWLELTYQEVMAFNWIKELCTVFNNCPLELKLENHDLILDMLSGVKVDKFIYHISHLQLHPNNLIAIKDIIEEGFTIEKILRSCSEYPEL